MIQSFTDETAADLFRERNTRYTRHLSRDVWPVARRN